MPPSAPDPREPLHTCRLEIRGYHRDDGLWDIEGHLVDTKVYAFENSHRGEVAAGEPVHEMWLRLTLDGGLTIRGVEAVTDHGPFRPCPDATANFAKLEGLRIGPGWNRAVRERTGGVKGCTHLNEMLAQMATTAFQTLYSTKRRNGDATESRAKGETASPPLLNSCHAFAADGEVVKEFWPEKYTGA